MKEKLKQLVADAAGLAHAAGDLPSPRFPAVELEEPKADAHGDFSTNFCMQMASAQKMSPRRIADILVARMRAGLASDPEPVVDRVEIAGPGFVNFFLKPSAWHPVLKEVHTLDPHYGASQMGRGARIQVEFVSSNPTGPLHVGHGRGAAVGDSVANILAFCGYDVQKEYYINDSGRQIATLGRSVYLRYRQAGGEAVDFPADCYQGGYIREIAGLIREKEGDRLLAVAEGEAVEACARFAAGLILEGMRRDLEDFGVTFDRWFSEQSLYDDGKVEAAIERLKKRGLAYIRDGALWFRSTAFGDEKDRVMVRANGLTTYFAADIAYHQDKFERGFDRVVDVWGADHHGYIRRVTAAVEAAGYDGGRFQVILVQLVNLLRGGEPVAMSTRAGEFVTLKDVVDEVGRDAARFLFLTRHHDSALDFDLEVAKKQTNDNPVFYVQYVHARIASIARKADERGVAEAVGDPRSVAALTAPEEVGLIKALARYPEVVETAAGLMEPHRVTFYLMDLAAGFHAYYNRHRVLDDDPALAAARLCLVRAVQKVIRNGLTLLGVTAPETM